MPQMHPKSIALFQLLLSHVLNNDSRQHSTKKQNHVSVRTKEQKAICNGSTANKNAEIRATLELRNNFLAKTKTRKILQQPITVCKIFIVSIFVFSKYISAKNEEYKGGRTACSV